ncbi:MAG: DMT family transporter [Rikenellaceae bacterium]
MWLLLGVCSSFLLGFWEIAKKIALKGNNAMLVLFWVAFFGAVLFMPLIVLSKLCPELLPKALYVADGTFNQHLMVMLKSTIVGTSWIWGYYSLKHLPLTITGPIKAARPAMVLMGAIVIFGERLNVYQWLGVFVAMTAIFLLSLTGKREGIVFKNNKWVFYCVLSTAMGGVSALYDKYLLGIYEPMFVQSWYTVYAFVIMGVILVVSRVLGKQDKEPFVWRNAIVAIAVLIAVADALYFYALSDKDSMISIVSLIRRGSVIVSFIYGAIMLREKNVPRKVVALVLMFVGLLFLALGSV